LKTDCPLREGYGRQYQKDFTFRKFPIGLRLYGRGQKKDALENTTKEETK